MSKKIINNRMYNTETAKELGCWDNGYPRHDFRFSEEILYQKNGEYFLYGVGGAMSPYGAYGSNFRPFTKIEAKRWVLDRLNADAYVALFGDVEE